MKLEDYQALCEAASTHRGRVPLQPDDGRLLPSKLHGIQGTARTCRRANKGYAHHAHIFGRKRIHWGQRAQGKSNKSDPFRIEPKWLRLVMRFEHRLILTILLGVRVSTLESICGHLFGVASPVSEIGNLVEITSTAPVAQRADYFQSGDIRNLPIFSIWQCS